MSFLAINGIDLEAIVGSYNESPREIGETTNAYNGTLRKSRQDTKFDITLETPPMTQADAWAWDGLLRGLGHSWSFNSSLYSSKGLPPNATTGLSVSTGTNGRNSTEALLVTAAGSPNTAVYATELGSSWTVALWRKQTSGGTYAHYVVTSDGHKWVDGSRNDGASTTFISVSSGTLTLTGHTADAVYFEDVLAVPFVMPDAWPPLYYAFVNAAPQPDVPKLTVTGDAIAETSRTMMGSVSNAKFIKAVIDGSFRTNGRVLSVALTEV
jgi:hypothetical protein